MEENKQSVEKGYIYLRNHEAYDKYDLCKIGKTENIPERDTTYVTGEVMRGKFTIVFEVPHKQMNIIERHLNMKFADLNKRFDGGIEFYNKKIIELIEPYLIELNIKYKKLTEDEIDKLIRINRIKKSFTSRIKRKLIHSLKNINIEENKPDNKHIWKERNYQINIINYGMEKLLSENKIYIELPTGGGKSYIVYNLLELLKSEVIIIVSPRKIVNSQNISSKYLQILTDKYVTFNYSLDENFELFLQSRNKKLITCCTQSINKIYETIKSCEIRNISIWFDEAHWGVEEWVDKLIDDEIKSFWLLNNEYISYRIFTSASPDKNKISENERIFGQLYSPIKVKELIDLKWLCPLKPFVYSENKSNIDNIKYITEEFNDKKRKYGFSFHNKQKNAFNLFYKHYLLYKNGEISIKPFLLVGYNFNIEIEPKLKEIELDYDYRNIKVFEDRKTIYKIGYVVAMYTMGYDFNKLDFMIISDPKLSIQDIIQSIGRGIRPDELGGNGSNKEKNLVLLLPVYVDDDDDNKYTRIIEVIKYLFYDIKISIEDIVFQNRYTTPRDEEKSSGSEEYLGVENIKSVLLNLLENENKRISLGITYENAKKIIYENNITSKEAYYKLCERDNRLINEPEILFKKQFTDWMDYLSIDKRKFYNLETCKKKVSEYLIKNPELKKNYLNPSLISSELCKTDNLFPPEGLWLDCYNAKKLNEIIIINKKKKMNIKL